MRTALCLFAALCGGVPAAQAACDPARPPAIDVHLHAYGVDPRYGVPTPTTGRPNPARDAGSHRRATLDAMTGAGIVRGVVSGGELAAAERMVAESGGRLRLGYQVNDVVTAADLATIRRLHAEGRLTEIGEVAPAYAGLRLDDPGLDPLWALAAELDVPVAVHTGSGPPDAWETSPRHLATAGDPLLLEPALKRHPKLRILLMHMGYPMTDQTVALMSSYSRVSAEVGAIAWLVPRAAFHRYLQRLVDEGFGERLLFGSDQMAWPDGVGLSLDALDAAPFLTAQQRLDMRFNNAVRWHRWTDLSLCRAAP